MPGNNEMKLSWTLAKDTLSESDKNRLACCFFHFGSNGKINYETAATDFGAATPAAMRVGVYSIMAKLKQANGIQRSAGKAGSARSHDDYHKEDIGKQKRKRGVSTRGESEDGGQNATRNAKARCSAQPNNLIGRKMIHGKGEDPKDDDANDSEDNHEDDKRAIKVKSEPYEGAEDLGSPIVA